MLYAGGLGSNMFLLDGSLNLHVFRCELFIQQLVFLRPHRQKLLLHILQPIEVNIQSLPVELRPLDHNSLDVPLHLLADSKFVLFDTPVHFTYPLPLVHAGQLHQ